MGSLWGRRYKCEQRLTLKRDSISVFEVYPQQIRPVKSEMLAANQTARRAASPAPPRDVKVSSFHGSSNSVRWRDRLVPFEPIPHDGAGPATGLAFSSARNGGSRVGAAGVVFSWSAEPHLPVGNTD